MNLAFAITFLWVGAALLYVAFHPLSLESSKGVPGDVVESLRGAIEKGANAYEVAGAPKEGGHVDDDDHNNLPGGGEWTPW